jgi:hypothetical protein
LRNSATLEMKEENSKPRITSNYDQRPDSFMAVFSLVILLLFSLHVAGQGCGGTETRVVKPAVNRAHGLGNCRHDQPNNFPGHFNDGTNLDSGDSIQLHQLFIHIDSTRDRRNSGQHLLRRTCHFHVHIQPKQSVPVVCLPISLRDPRFNCPF